MLKAKSGKRQSVMRRKEKAAPGPSLTVVIGTPPPPKAMPKAMGRAMRQGKAPEAPDARDDEMAALRDEIAALAARLDALSPMTDDEDDDE
jgi:hypothetical protein